MKREKRENSANYGQFFVNEGKESSELESLSNSLWMKAIKEDGIISQVEADEIYKRLKSEAESRANHGM